MVVIIYALRLMFQEHTYFSKCDISIYLAGLSASMCVHVVLITSYIQIFSSF